MEFIVKDYDSIGDHEVLGSALVSKTDMLNGTGARHEYELGQYGGKKNIVSSGGKKVSSKDRKSDVKHGGRHLQASHERLCSPLLLFDLR